MDYVPRKGFVFSMYRDYPMLQMCRTKEEISEMMFWLGIEPYQGAVPK